MFWLELLFGFEGRLNRARYWKAVLAALAAVALGVFLVQVLVPLLALSVQYAIRVLLGLFIALPVIVAGLATLVKRLHDHNFSGWWLLALLLLTGAIGVTLEDLYKAVFLPFGFVWPWLTNQRINDVVLIGIGLLLGAFRGTSGANRYGADPLKAVTPAADAVSRAPTE